MTTPRTWRIHIGAHKTATTHLQDTLAGHKSHLQKRGIRLITREEIRGARFKTRLPKIYKFTNLGGVYIRSKRHRITEFVNGGIISVLSEENIIGGSSDLLKNDFYPNVANRLAILHKLIPHQDRTFFLSIRNQAEIIPSAYFQEIRQKPIEGGFNRVKNSILSNPPSWQEFIERLLRFLPSDKLRVWTLEDYINNQNTVLTNFIGCDVPEYLPLNIPKNTKSPSWEAIKEIEKLGEKERGRRYSREVQRIISSDNGHTKFRPFSDEEYRNLSEIYEDDKKFLSQKKLCFNY